MKILVLLSVSLAVALGVPLVVPDVDQNHVLTVEKQSPLLGDLVPVHGHVVVENPAPQVMLSSKGQEDKKAPVDTKQSENTVEVDVKEKQELKAEAEVKVEEMGMVEQEVKVVQVEQEVKPESEVSAEAETEQKTEIDSELQDEQNFKVESEVKVPDVPVEENLIAEQETEPEPEVPVEAGAEVEQEIVMDPELQAEPDFKVESEVLVEPDVQMEIVPEEVNEEETDKGLLMEERHIDMEGKYETMGEPDMELEPLDDDNMFGQEVSDTEPSEEEKSSRAEIQGQDPGTEPLSEDEEEEKEIMRLRNEISPEQSILELESEMIEEPFPNQDFTPEAAVLEKEPELDTIEQQAPSENYFPDEELVMQMRPEKQEDLDEPEYLMMNEEAQRAILSEEELPAQLFEDQEMEGKGPQTDVMLKSEPNALMRDEQGTQERSYCTGVLLGGKCYQFFSDRKKAADAEFFCQHSFPDGHLASITSREIHREVMNLILTQNGGYTRTWVGGLRYLNTNRFVWLDGSHWTYTDWLSGEPNHTAGVEDCLEVLGNGKFNDFTCWEPQAFICSYSV